MAGNLRGGRPSSAYCSECTSGRRDRCPWIDEMEPGQSSGKAHYLTIGADDLEGQLGVREVPGGRVVMAPGENIGRTDPLQVEIDGGRTVDVGEPGVVLRDLDQDGVDGSDRLTRVLVQERAEHRAVGVGVVRGRVRVYHAVGTGLVEDDAIGDRGHGAGRGLAR